VEQPVAAIQQTLKATPGTAVRKDLKPRFTNEDLTCDRRDYRRIFVSAVVQFVGTSLDPWVAKAGELLPTAQDIWNRTMKMTMRLGADVPEWEIVSHGFYGLIITTHRLYIALASPAAMRVAQCDRYEGVCSCSGLPRFQQIPRPRHA